MSFPCTFENWGVGIDQRSLYGSNEKTGVSSAGMHSHTTVAESASDNAVFFMFCPSRQSLFRVFIAVQSKPSWQRKWNVTRQLSENGD